MTRDRIKQFFCLHERVFKTSEFFVPVDKTLKNGYYWQTGKCLRCGKSLSRPRPIEKFEFTSLEPFE